MSCEAIYRPKNRVNGKPKLDNPHYGHKVLCLWDMGSFGKVVDAETDTLIYAWKDELEFIEKKEVKQSG